MILRGRSRYLCFGNGSVYVHPTHRALPVALEPAIHTIRMEAVLAVQRPDLLVAFVVHKTDRTFISVLFPLGHILCQEFGRDRVLFNHLLTQARVQPPHPNQLQQSVQARLDAHPTLTDEQAVPGQSIGQR